ncbi:MAG: thioredoxin domain-containing protein [Candidatus Magasanikbacteria bacterium]|nr:thioredoxin domain-containing protein [Candidatus Magasanikbacteria bacterium]
MCYAEIKKAFGTLDSKTSFWLGFVVSVLVLGTVGFIVMLVLFLTGADNASSGFKTDKTAAVDNKQAAGNEYTESAGTVAPVTDRDHSRGPADAQITLIEYSDFECPFCKKFHSTMKEVYDTYPGKIKWVYRHYPLSFHANAGKEAEATECAYELGGHEKFWQYADKIYERTTSNGTGFALADLPKLAAELGLNKSAFETCLNSNKYASYVAKSLQDGQTAGVKGTPGTIIISTKGELLLVKGALPLNMMKDLVDKAL